MERRFFKSSVISLLFLLSFQSFAQHVDFTERIHIPLWAEIDALPELQEAQSTNDGIFDFAINRIRKVGPYFLNGMVYGWNFSYTPSDKLRGVKEYFEVEEINTIKEQDNPITYAKPWIEDNLLHCWLEYERTPQQIWNLKAWSAITTDKIQGKGSGKISHGFEGIQEAGKEALKNAIRSHYREIIKNKPKLIEGKVIIRTAPKIGLKSGQYMVELDFFLETDRIVKYSQF